MTDGLPDLWIVLVAALILVALLIAAAIYVLRGAMKSEPPPALIPAPGPGQALQPMQQSAVATSFQSALEVLRQRVTGNSFQYRVPWILMVGPPGSGKTSI